MGKLHSRFLLLKLQIVMSVALYGAAVYVEKWLVVDMPRHIWKAIMNKKINTLYAWTSLLMLFTVINVMNMLWMIRTRLIC